MSEQNDITNLHVQRSLKPKIEDVLPFYLEGDMLETALDFVAYLRANKMNLTWAGIHNAWKAAYKGKPILYIRLNCKHWNEDEFAKWVVTPYPINIFEYEKEIVKKDLQDLIWNGFLRCKVFVNDYHCGNGCNPGVNKTIFGKELKNLCHGNFYSGRNWVWLYDPSATIIDRIKKLLELEKQARNS